MARCLSILLISLITFCASNERLSALPRTAVYQLESGNVFFIENVTVLYVSIDEYPVFGVHDCFPLFRDNGDVQFNRLVCASPSLKNKARYTLSIRIVATEFGVQSTHIDSYPYTPNHVMGRCLACVFDPDIYCGHSILVERYCRLRYVNVSPQLAFSRVGGDFNGSGSSYRRPTSFQGSPKRYTYSDQKKAGRNRSNDNLGVREAYKSLSGDRHAALRVQILAGVITGVAVGFLIFGGVYFWCWRNWRWRGLSLLLCGFSTWLVGHVWAFGFLG